MEISLELRAAYDRWIIEGNEPEHIEMDRNDELKDNRIVNRHISVSGARLGVS